ncbi:MAG: hypothetical protein P4L61_04090 [Candidatus Pacebacteria bacterium]|nr:hypothetical protein [Candidatus Paceibacterota bacterium]
MQTSDGSLMKASESKTQKRIDKIRRAYEAAEGTPLDVRFVGIMDADNMEMVLPSLLKEDFSSRPVAYHAVVDTGKGLRVHVTKGFRSNWYSVNDRVGFVERNPNVILKAAIEKKAQDLAVYQKVAGDDVRLLLVADRIQNSGKIAINEVQGTFNLHGFRAVYLFPYPESAFSLIQTA